MFYGEDPLLGALVLSHVVLMLAAWIYLYRKAAAARDFIFWGAIVYFVPYLGAIAVFVYFRHRNKRKILN